MVEYIMSNIRDWLWHCDLANIWGHLVWVVTSNIITSLQPKGVSKKIIEHDDSWIQRLFYRVNYLFLCIVATYVQKLWDLPSYMYYEVFLLKVPTYAKVISRALILEKYLKCTWIERTEDRPLNLLP